MQRSSSTVSRRNTHPSSFFSPQPRLTPLVHAIALMLATGAAVQGAHAQQAFSPAWMAQKSMAQSTAAATGRLPNGMPASMLTSPQAQQQRAGEQLQRSIGNLNIAARGIAAQQAAQEAARRAAIEGGQGVPDGLAEGGLRVDTASLTAGWANANAPVQTQGEGRTQVTVAQTGAQAILNWETFNVGKNTTLKFEQQPSWAVLNRVNDPNARPSQIQGQIQADGTVLVVNRNGIVFSGSSQVNTRNLVASAVGLSDAQFKKGLYSDAQGSAFVPTLANDLAVTATGFTHGAATADVTVEAGARIATHRPTSVTEGGGYVLLAGRESINRGHIETPSGQAVLAAGDAFVIRKGMGTDANQTSSTRGNVVTPLYLGDSAAGRVVNSGLVQAPTGDITMVGRQVRQEGVLEATTSVHTRGTIHLLADQKQAGATVTLAPGSISAIRLDADPATALDVQRESLLTDSDKAGGDGFNRRDQSLVRIVSGGNVDFQGESLTLATGGQVMVDAARRSQVASGARIDVSGAVGVNVAMEANNVQVDVQGNEQRDAPGNRDSKRLNNSKLWIDRRTLVRVPKDAQQGYDTDRWYTAGGLLEVSGYLGTDGHGIGEWAAQGGTVQFAGRELVTQGGSSINLSGGTLDVQTGNIRQSYLKGRDGRLYEASKAPGDLLYDGVYKGFESAHKRWGDSATDFFYNPLIAPQQRLESGYTVGRDAGRLVVATGAAVLEGELTTAAFQGPRQQRARDAGMEGYLQSQTAVAKQGQLVIGALTPYHDKALRNLRNSPEAVVEKVDIGTHARQLADGLALAQPLPEAAAKSLLLDAGWLSSLGLGELRVYAAGGIQVDGAVSVAHGGTLALHATEVKVNADLTARGGSILLGNMIERRTSSAAQPWLELPIEKMPPGGYFAQTRVAPGVTLDARGLWTNLKIDRNDIAGLPYVDGGSVSMRSTGSVALGTGSLIDVSSGAALMEDGSLRGGKGGNVTLGASQNLGAGALAMDGELRGYGVRGGGKLSVEHGTTISIGGMPTDADKVLQGGLASAQPLRLANDYVIGAGAPIPMDFSVTSDRLAPGQVVRQNSQPRLDDQNPVITAAPWVSTSTVQLASGKLIAANQVVPAGSALVGISNIPAGYVLPADVFPNGLPTFELVAVYKAGTASRFPVTVPAGTRIATGTVWPDTVAVVPFLALDPSLFQRGFSRYAVNSPDGISVVDGAQLQVVMPVLRFDPAAGRMLATGGNTSQALQAWLPPLQQENAVRRTLTMRDGADLSLKAGTLEAEGALTIGTGARIQVDPGRAIALEANAQTTIDGLLQAPGGRISVLRGAYKEAGPADTANGLGDNRSIWIGEHAELDVSGRAFTATDSLGHAYGKVSAGGTIEIGVPFDLDTRKSAQADAFVVVRPGARLDASGATATLYQPGAGPLEAPSQGGVISLTSSRGLYLDGQMRAASGGAGAAGGTLALTLETPIYGPVANFTYAGPTVTDTVRKTRELVLAQTQGDGVLAAGLQAGAADPALTYGHARVGVDRIQAGGFDNLALGVNGVLSFDGSVQLRLGQSLRLTASSLGLVENAPIDSRIVLSAPYVRLGGSANRQVDNTLMPNPVTGARNLGQGSGELGVPKVAAGSSLRVDADQIDIAGDVMTGTRGLVYLNNGKKVAVERLAFDDMRLASQGDIRFQDRGGLYVPGNLTLAAAQIYPASNEMATVVAGRYSTPRPEFGTVDVAFDPQRTLTVERIGNALPDLPQSVFGQLTLSAAKVVQGGVLRAPLGGITLGSATGSGYTGLVELMPGSVTSVSAAGLRMPYGGTSDGLNYVVNGKDVEYRGVGRDPSVSLVSHAVDVHAGAVVDLSGGGELTGTAFLPGRGGSVDARMNPLMQRSADGHGFVLPGLATNPVYAIVPGMSAAYAPVNGASGEKGASSAAVGRQITIGAGVPGLPPGTYTLLPSTYALLPGAFRVELNGLAPSVGTMGTAGAMRNGSWAASGQLGTAGTAFRDAMPTQVILTPADTLRTYSQYNEMGYSAFAQAQALREGVPRAVLERDAKSIRVDLVAPTQAGSFERPQQLRFAGSVLAAPAEGGRGSTASVGGGSDVEILPDGASRTPGFTGVSIHASELNAIGAARLVIGGQLTASYTDNKGSLQQANMVNATTQSRAVVLRAGSELRAAEVFLITSSRAGGITVEQGASINTLGRGNAAYDSKEGFVFAPGPNSLVAVSNGWLDMLAPTLPTEGDGKGAGAIQIGVCTLTPCAGVTRLYSEGTITAATDNAFNLGEAVRYGTRNLVLAVGGVNVGSEKSLADATARGVLPPGLTLNQGVLDRLLRGDTEAGAPALENLVLTVRDSLNFYDTATLSTIDPATGRSSVERLVLGTPAIYGHGSADALARIQTDTLVWNGANTPAGNVVAGGAGTGSGRLAIDARRIEFGFGPGARVDSVHTFDRTTLGFADVSLNASERITANRSGSLSVYQSRGPWDQTLNDFSYSGGTLHLRTPLLTGRAGSVNRISAGGDIDVAAFPGERAGAPDNAALADALGAELSLDSRKGNLRLDTAVLLPSGKLSLAAQGDLLLGAGAQIDMAGRRIDFFDSAKHSWGGDVLLESRAGNIAQAAGSAIDVSAVENRAGKIVAMALGDTAGTVSLAGTLRGASSGHYDAGGTDVPYAAGRADIRAQHIDDFTGLNQRLNDGGVVGGRSFQLRQGDLLVGNELRAREINVSVDNGQLTVAGTVDASGEQVGSIRLAAKNGVTLAGNAVLDAHGSVLRVDSYGQAIDAPNRAVIEIDAGSGRLRIEPGVRMDLRAGGSGRSFGTVALNAPRLGGATGNDIGIDAAGGITIDGARSIMLNAFWRYDDAPVGTDVGVDGRSYQSVTQAYLNAKHADSTVFMANALGNGTLMNARLQGLRAYGDAFHLRPGIEIASRTADGDLHLDGDIDLSGYRYQSVNPHTQRTGVAGSGEAGALVLRAKGRLDVFGSLSDGFDGARLPVTPDDKGWVLPSGRIPLGGDMVLPQGGRVTLDTGTFFQSGRVLNYDLPMQAMSLARGTLLPVTATLSQPLALAKGAVLGGAVRDAAGNELYAAGTVLPSDVTLPAGAQLGAGFRLNNVANVAAMTWPHGVALPFPDGVIHDQSFPGSPLNGVQLARPLALAKGAVIPSETLVRLPGGINFVDLRDREADGTQGRTWALAPLLAQGSQSWDLRLVGGADLSAADSRLTQPHANAGIRLSDTHYGSSFIRIEIPGTATPGEFMWAIDADVALWNEQGLGFDIHPGQALTPAQVEEVLGWGGLELNNFGVGPLLVQTAPGKPPQTRLEEKPLREPIFSVLRTGTGDLDLVSGGDILMTSPYGVYTAGTPSASLAQPGKADLHNLPRGQQADGSMLGSLGTTLAPFVDGSSSQSLYQAWYPEHGGNLLLRAGGDVMGDQVGSAAALLRTDPLGVRGPMTSTSSVGQWLWRQGGGAVAQDVPTAWWINFGTYVAGAGKDSAPYLMGFTGFGTLGGGNLVFEAGRDAGMLNLVSDWNAAFVSRSQGLSLAVGSTGRVTSAGELVLTGGGDLDIRIGGGLNPVAETRSFAPYGGSQVATDLRRTEQRLDLNGTFTNLRGALRVDAGAVGGIELRYDRADPTESRALRVNVSSSGIAGGGPVLVLGDSGLRVEARGDLVIGTVTDAGRVPQFNGGVPFTSGGSHFAGGGIGWFSLWTPATAVDLFSAGGNLTPGMAWTDNRERSDQVASGDRFIYPSVLRAASANGSLYYGNAVTGTFNRSNVPDQSSTGILLAPTPVGAQFVHQGKPQLELLAGDSIYASGYAVTPSGVDPAMLPTPFNPGFVGLGQAVWYGPLRITNVHPDAIAPSVLLSGSSAPNVTAQSYPLFSFVPPTASGYSVTGQAPSRFYAVQGDIVGLRTGSIISRSEVFGPTDTWYEGSGPVAIRAGRDIVNAGTPLGAPEALPANALGWTRTRGPDSNAPYRPEPSLGNGFATGNLIVHNHIDDVSVVEAGRDIRYSSFYVAGPGQLELTAGRDVYMADKAELRSVGSVARGPGVVPGDRRSGAGIAVTVGAGREGADWAAFAARYLDPKNLANADQSFAEQPGKALRTYEGALSLAQWLAREFGYGGDEAGAPAYLAGKQAELDRGRQGSGTGGGAAIRTLEREYRLESGLHLVNWLAEHFGGANGLGLHFDAKTMDARAFFDALPQPQQRAFLRNVYYAELKAGGREYNDPKSRRSGSYLRGREAIATLLPSQDAQGNARSYAGDLTMFSSARYFELSGAEPTKRPLPGKTYMRYDEWLTMGGTGTDLPYYKVLDAGMHTDFGGDISLLVPGGRAVVGVDGGFTPGEGSGLLTQGEGDINVYTHGSLLLGQSRIFTTFGGNVLAWSAQGDINAGRGAKTTIVYTPQRRAYDNVGNVALSPNTPNTGAGIATLNPIPEIPPGDVDLIAPLGTIDAGEAGIRVSGNVNLAALRVVNAENIQVKGQSVGIPVIAAVNVGALTNASAAASQAAAAAQDVLQRDRAAQRQALPSVFSVRVLGFGNEGAGGGDNGAAPKAREPHAAYDPQGVVQVLGAGTLTAAQMQSLTPGEKRGLRQ
ncbi:MULTISPECIES: filamentous haemagglutinin family protein [unclassified Variovorax]|uniref:filamentous haemagglutinin family protein n=1 Tax=unclassified Variovorax TaxID=663243 RepID=UPI0008BC9D82|nr:MULTISPECIES: filamentous haemagglutinin family protein [unclassified Variovorax]SEK14760.1 filamentous hemagglutinin family N-terminal domain-containing protein [Variovorax sp. OK202]SFE03532.1 filamentous hemagglutinin family N-terminal domain-containing protein [Variovorax sp. OK212]